MYTVYMIKVKKLRYSSVQFSRSVMSNSLQPHELQHARPSCPSTTPGVHPNSCPSSQWCHPAISFSVIPFSSCLQSLPASVFSNESTLRMRWTKYWSFSFSISPSKEQPGLISFRWHDSSILFLHQQHLLCAEHYMGHVDKMTLPVFSVSDLWISWDDRKKKL